MAHQVLSSDMAQLIGAMRLAQQYGMTLLDSSYRKSMLQSAHVLAVDAKHLLETVDNARRCRVAWAHGSTVPLSPSTHAEHEQRRHRLGVAASSAVL